MEALFEIETWMLGRPYDTAYAEDAGGAFLAVTTLLKEMALQGGEASVRDLETNEIVWRGSKPYWTSGR